MPVTINGSDGITNASWTTGTRPSNPVAGQMGYNTETNSTEVYIGNEWISLGGFAPIQATGGNVSDITVKGRLYRVHEFTNVGSSTFSVSNTGSDGKIEYLIVAGGGGGGGGCTGGGGGGAGGVILDFDVIDATDYTVVVGGGGDGQDDSNNPADSGNNSSFGNITAIGGGGGGSRNNSDARDGGSGGGGARQFGKAGLALQPTSTDGGFGSNGGDSAFRDPPLTSQGDNTSSGGSGGGGAGSRGDHAMNSRINVDGGEGIVSSITGTSKMYAAGGSSGGEGQNQGIRIPRASGIGGQGGGEVETSLNPTSGINGTGSGGGGGSCVNNFSGAAGGDGVVVIRYPLEAE